MKRIDASHLEKTLFPYQLETRRPIVCLVFVAPLLLLYELGILLLGNQAIRNGLDEMFRFQMHRLGAGELIILPLLTIAVLLVWHHWKKDRWQIRPAVLAGMLLESVFLGFILLWAAKAQSALLGEAATSEAITLSARISAANSVEWWSTTVSYLGAGIYEELVFRLLVLLPVIALGKRFCGEKKVYLVVSVVFVSSLFFALLHYQGLNPAGAPFDWPSFTIRVAASMFFCLVFVTRGFGIAVGTHAAYDVLTQF